jgi:hypothetical protein
MASTSRSIREAHHLIRAFGHLKAAISAKAVCVETSETTLTTRPLAIPATWQIKRTAGQKPHLTLGCAKVSTDKPEWLPARAKMNVVPFDMAAIVEIIFDGERCFATLSNQQRAR